MTWRAAETGHEADAVSTGRWSGRSSDAQSMPEWAGRTVTVGKALTGVGAGLVGGWVPGVPSAAGSGEATGDVGLVEHAAAAIAATIAKSAVTPPRCGKASVSRRRCTPREW